SLLLWERSSVLFPLPERPATPPRVVITGAGIVTALGLDWRSNAEGFRLGRTAFRRVSLFDASRQRVKVAAEIEHTPNPPATRLTWPVLSVSAAQSQS